MFFAIREILGWLLVLVALLVLWIGLRLVLNSEEPRIIEAGAFVFGGTAVLKAGVLLVRISTAARIARLEPPADVRLSSGDQA